MGYQRSLPTKTATADKSRGMAIAPKSPSATHPCAHPLLQLQRQIGNQAVSQLIQAKLKVGKAGDTYEQEADRVADTVMRMPEAVVQQESAATAQTQSNSGQISPFVQRQTEEKKEETAQAKPEIGQITPFVQRQAEEKKEEPVQTLQRQAEEKKEEPVQTLQRQAEEKKEEPVQMLQRQTEEKKEEPVQTKGVAEQTPEVTPDVENRIQSMQSGGQPLPGSTRSFFESRFGYDFSSVRVHTDSQADDVSRKLNAQAFTIRQNVFFSSGRYEPHTTQGKWLLAHELTHTVQQQSSKPLAANSPSVQSYPASNSPTHSPVRLHRKADTGAISISPNHSNAAICASLQRFAIARKIGGKKSPASPAQDPAFKAVVERTKTAANKQKQHPPAKNKAAEAQAAAKSPANEIASKAAGNQVQQMDQQQPKPFDRKAFKAALLSKIQATVPKNLKEADEFKESGKLSTVKGDLTGQVDTSKKQSQGNVETTVKAAPSTSGIEPKSVTPLPPTEKGAPPAKIGAAQAAPKPKTADEVSLQEGSQSLDQKMADAEVTDEQLKKSNEPDFQTAADAKKEAQTDAVKAPQEYRQQEQGILTQAQNQAAATAQTQLTGMHATRGQQQNQVTGSQRQTQSKDEQERTRVANEIQAIYDQTKQKAEARLSKLDTDVNQAFDSGANQAQQAFENYVKRRMDAYKDERYSGVIGAGQWVADKFLGLPDEVNAFYREGRDLYLKLMDAVLDKVAATVEKGLNEAKEEIAKGRKAVQDYVNKQPANLRKAAQDAAQTIQSQFDQLEQSVNDKQNQLIESLAQKYNEKLQAIDARIEAMQAENRGLVDQALDAVAGVIKTILELKNMLMGVLAKSASAINKIIKDPIGFLGNLVAGVKQGFMNFVGNIGAHLQKGLMGWLFGAIAEAGIQLPESFDLKGILGLVMQVLGMTWAFIRARAVKILGEPVVKALETTAEIFKILITQGPAGLWEYIKEQLSNLKDVVIEGIKSFVTESIIKAGVTWIIGLLNPAGAFIKACKAIYDIIMFFVERGSQIIALVNAVTDSVSAIADGAIGAAASAVENALSKAVPVVISFLAALLGVTGITGKIRSIIEKVQAPVSKAIDWVINKAYNLVKAAGKLLGFGKKKDKQREKTDQEGKPLEVSFSMSGEQHKLIVVPAPIPSVEMASKRDDLSKKIGMTVAGLVKQEPKPINQINDLKDLGGKVKTFEKLVQTHAKMTPPQQVPSSAPEIVAMTSAMSTYAKNYNANDIDVFADDANDLRSHGGYSWLTSQGLSQDFEARIVAKSDQFPREKVKVILDQIVRFKGITAFEAKVKRAVSENRFWSPNVGFFFEITDLKSIADIKLFDVSVGGRTIDVLTGNGVLIDQKFVIDVDYTDPANPKLSNRMLKQVQAMQAAVGSMIQGIKITDFAMHIAQPLTPDAIKLLQSHGIHSHFKITG